MNRRQAEQNKAVDIEQSLETLELFKMTNLNRISQDEKQPTATLTSEVSGNALQNAAKALASATRKAPRLMKSPFADEFCQPSPATRTKNNSIASHRSKASIGNEHSFDQ